MILNKILLISLLMLGFGEVSLSAQAENTKPWTLASKQGNIEVYRRASLHSSIDEVRMTANIKSSFSDFMKMLNDVPAYVDWVYKCTETKRLKTINDSEFYYYTISDLPFPMSDRDMVVHTWQSKDAKTGTIHTRSIAEPNFIPTKSGIVRVPFFESSWQIRPKENGYIHIEYQVTTEVGGNLPAWLINLGITSGPLKTMEQLEYKLSNPTHHSDTIMTK